LFITAAGAGTASALPSFSRQTGESCDACHVGSFGPQLTPHGMRFKLAGYTDTDGKRHLPLSAMLVANITHTKDPQDVTILPEDSHSNNNAAMQELSGFVAGRLAPGLGSFVQITYSGVEKKTSLDNLDVRYARSTKVAGQQALVGVSVNNNPTVQDPFNTTPAWRFPFTSSDYAPGPGFAPVIDGGIEMQALGASAYVLLDNGLYAEAGAYHALGADFLEKVHIDPTTHVSGFAPYGRVAYTKEGGGRWYSVGLFGMRAATNSFDTPSGPADTNTDIGVDGHYQFLGTRKHVMSVDASFIHEAQTLDASAAGETASLKQLNISGSYHFQKTYGLSLRHFNTSGTNPDAESKGWTVQGDWTPFGKESSWHAPVANVRLGLQYNLFNTLNGVSKAGGSNSVVGFVWFSL
jgi:hypothetical protein